MRLILHVGDQAIDLAAIARLARDQIELPEHEELTDSAHDAGNGVYFSARALGGGSWGIRTLAYRGGSLETENLNTTPWPTEEIALQRAEMAARAEAQREDLPFRGRARDAYEQESYRGFMITESPGSGFIIHKGGVRYGSKPTLA